MFNRRSLAGLPLALAAPRLAIAQDRYPSRPVRFINPYGPGGATDIIGRLIAEQFRQIFGQPFVVENRPGAGGMIASELVARSRPDGYTLILGNTTTNMLTPLLYRGRAPVDVFREIVPISRLADLPAVVAVSTANNFAPRTVREVIDYARAHPGEVRYVTPGAGTYAHFDMELLAKREGVEFTHIPMPQGAGPINTALIRGDAQLISLNAAVLQPLLATGQIRGIAVFSDGRMPEYPDLPTMAEAGYPGIGTVSWLALYAPAGMPPDVMSALHAATQRALASDAVREAFQRQMIRATPSASPAEALEWQNSEITTWRRIIAETGIELTG